MNTPKQRLTALCVAVALSMAPMRRTRRLRRRAVRHAAAGRLRSAAFRTGAAARRADRVVSRRARRAGARRLDLPVRYRPGSNWVRANASPNGSQLAAAVDPQPWDPSVKALTQFPSVLDNMASNLAWTSALGPLHGRRRPGDGRGPGSAPAVAGGGNAASTSQQTVSNQGARS